jgi:hypothetical protein
MKAATEQSNLKIRPRHPENCTPGTDVMILKIFSSKHLAKKLASFCENLIITLVFEKNLFAKNRR